MARSRNSPGSLRHRITVETDSRSSDGRGGVTRSWTTHITAWASIRVAQAREAYQRGAVAGSRLYVMRLRYQAGVTPKMRVSWDSRVFKITGVTEVDEESRWLELECVEEPV